MLYCIYIYITHPTAVQPVLHDADELLVGQLVVVVHVEDLEDGVDQVARQLQARGHEHGPGKLICTHNTVRALSAALPPGATRGRQRPACRCPVR